ncbi:MAG: DNA-directed RNA polymerase subunit omega [Clostridia bacterium]
MLSDPNISKIIPKVGNRYEAALAISKRARNIENRRVIEGDSDIRDAVDVASIEIAEEKVYVKKGGVFVIDQEKQDKSEKIVEEVIIAEKPVKKTRAKVEKIKAKLEKVETKNIKE